MNIGDRSLLGSLLLERCLSAIQNTAHMKTIINTLILDLYIHLTKREKFIKISPTFNDAGVAQLARAADL